MDKLYRKIVLFCTIFMIAFCAGGFITTQAAVKLNQKNITICIGQQTKLKIQGTKKTVKWNSTNRKIAKVDSSGNVTGVKSGETTIKAKVGKKTYQCTVKVNATYGADLSEITLKKKKSITILFTQNASVTYHIQNPSICSATWGTWSGNEVPLVITPKKIGKTSITCYNNANDEIIQIVVTVTSVPIEISDISVETTDQGELICGLNSARISFKQNQKSKKTILSILNRDGDTIRTMDLGAVTSKRYTTVWDGKTDKGVGYTGGYRIKITADGYVTNFLEYQYCYAECPFAGGTGSKKRPFEIATPEQLQNISIYNDRYFKQTADINLQSYHVSNLFTDSYPFSGQYDGGGYQISDCYENDSLFGVISSGGALQNIELQSFRMQLNRATRVAFLAKKNMGTITGCHIQDGLIHATEKADVAMLVVQNDGIIKDCSVSGKIYSYGNMGGCVVQNTQRMINCTASVELYFRASEEISTGSAIRVGGIVAENTGTAFVVDCKGDQSIINVTGVIPDGFTLYMGGMTGSNLGQINAGSFSGKFVIDHSSNIDGAGYIGVIAGENQGIISEVTYYNSDKRKNVGIGAGTVSDVHELPDSDTTEVQWIRSNIRSK